MTPQAIARLRALRDVGVLRIQPRGIYEGLPELARDGLVVCEKVEGGINVYLTDFGAQLAATIPPHSGKGIG